MISSSFEHFAECNNLFDDSLWAINRDLEQFSFKVSEMKIIRCGFLYRPGFLCKWQKSYFTLTDSGWLHCFDGSFPKNTDQFEINDKENQSNTFNEFHNFDSKLSLHYR